MLQKFYSADASLSRFQPIKFDLYLIQYNPKPAFESQIQNLIRKKYFGVLNSINHDKTRYMIQFDLRF